MAYKYTAFFFVRNGVANSGRFSQRVGGWTESLHHTTDLSAGGSIYWQALVKRRHMLTANAEIVAFRVADTTKVAGSRLIQVGYKGTVPAVESDIPKMALQVSGKSATGNVMRLLLRGIPDTWVSQGESALADAQIQKVLDYTELLTPFFQPCRSKTATERDIVAITSQGVVTPLTALTGVAVGSKVYILRPRTTEKGTHGGRYTVTALGDGNAFTIMGWYGGTAAGGTVRIAASVDSYYPDPMSIDGITTFEVGRPHFQLAGKR